MKKLISLTGLVFIIIVLITGGCEKPLDEQIIGKWEAKYHKYQAYDVDVFVSEEVDTLDAEELVIEIFEDGTGKTSIMGEPDTEFTWILDGSTITVTITNAKDGIMEWDVAIDKDKMTLTHSTPVTRKKGDIITRIVEVMIAYRID